MSTHPTDPKPLLPSRVRDLTDQQFGRFTVTGFAGHVPQGKQRSAAWHCHCSCGTDRVVLARSLQKGVSRSCGCLQREEIGARRRTHGMFRTPEYVAWMNMKKRCLNASYCRFRGYGGRGITICVRWLESFKNFIADMGARPSPKHSIERKDNDGNYEPANCTWAARPQQDSNKRTNRPITFGSETLTVKEWSRRTGINHETIRHRILIGWSAEQALTTPGRQPNKTDM